MSRAFGDTRLALRRTSGTASDFGGGREVAALWSNLPGLQWLSTVVEVRGSGLSRARCSSISVLDEDPSLAKLLAVAAARESDPPTLDVLSALHRAWAADLVTARYGATFDVGMMWADLHPSGDRIVGSGTMPVDGFLAGSYSIRFAGGRFDIFNDRRDEPFCTGGYIVRGTGCG